MELWVIGVLGVIASVLFIFVGLPVALCFMVVAFFSLAQIVGWQGSLAQLGRMPYVQASSYTLITIPMFILMGESIGASGLGTDLFRCFHKWFGGLRGGLAIATTATNAVFGAACGSSTAAAATIGTVAIPGMRQYNYHPPLATGSVVAAGTLAILIPPSTAFIIYGLLTEQSIGKLFMAGILPGVILTVLFMVTIYLWVRLKPTMAGRASGYSWKEKLLIPPSLILILITFFTVMGGIYLGVFTAVEAGGIGAFVVTVALLAMRKLSLKIFINAVRSTALTSCMIFAIIIGAMMLNTFVALSELPARLSGIITTLALGKYQVIAMIVVLYIILGCIMEALSMITLTLPVVFPVIVNLGFDPIWFGVILVVLIEMAMITPPVGMNLYVVSGIAPDIPQSDIFKGVAPFVVAIVVALVIFIAFPSISLILPSLMR